MFVISLSIFVVRKFRGTCSSVEMLKGYMVRDGLGTPALQQLILEYSDVICPVT